MTDGDDPTMTAFNQINWETLDINAVYAFYEACGRPLEARARVAGADQPGPSR
ncbi:hypothetical protein ABIF75_011601 [Bradyrhizobium japonicum]